MSTHNISLRNKKIFIWILLSGEVLNILILKFEYLIDYLVTQLKGGRIALFG